MKKLIFSFLLIFVFCTVAEAGRIRSMSLSKYQIGKIRLAPDHCTLVEVPSSNFKLVAGAPEYLEIQYQGNSFLIKPKAPGIKTNLFVLTHNGRFNLHLETTQPQFADEVITLKFRPDKKRRKK